MKPSRPRVGVDRPWLRRPGGPVGRDAVDALDPREPRRGRARLWRACAARGRCGASLYP